MDGASGILKRELDVDQLRTSVYGLDPVVALLSLIHITGERALLNRYTADFKGRQRGHRSSFAGTGGEGPKPVDPKIVEEIREALIAAMIKHPEPLLTNPGKALFKQMAELCIDMKLDDLACLMGREQAGFAKDEGASEPTKVPPADFKVLVLGAGMTGVLAGIKLKAAGFDFHIVEGRDEVGGTWSVNTYPNAAVDTPSVLYSFSFELNPDWSQFYPRGPEYLAYLKRVTDKYGLTDKIDFGVFMQKCVWNDQRKMWKVTCVRDGKEVTYEANAVVSAFGFLSRPLMPDVEGLDSFKGPKVHSGRWDPSLDFSGKRVVMIGTGATAAQMATGVAPKAGHLTVVQRQPNFMIQDDRVFQDVEKDQRWALANIPFVLQWQRLQSFSSLMILPHSMARIDPKHRQETGGVSVVSDMVRAGCIAYIDRKFADRPDLAAKLKPDFPFFAKRPILDCGYYDTLKRENVALVEGNVVKVEPDAVVLADGTRIPCDVLLLATGWKLDFMNTFDISGRGGKKLQDAWTPYPYAYLGMEVPGFPNLFMTSGPNSALTAAHTTTAEQQVHYIVEMLKAMVEKDAVAFEVTPAACEAYVQMIDEMMDGTVWKHKGTAHGYYRHESGRIVLGYPGPNVQYWNDLRQPKLEDYSFTPAAS